MLKIRGYLIVENRSYDEIKETMKDFDLEDFKVSLFKSITRDDTIVQKPGIFIDGKITQDSTSQDIIAIFKKKLGSDTDINRCDLSIDDIEIIKPVNADKVSGHYTIIRIKPKYDLDRVCRVADEIGTMTNASEIYVRIAEPMDDDNVICIDLITFNDFRAYKHKVEKLLGDNKLDILKYTSTVLEE